MSQYIHDEKGNQDQAASNTGWGDFCRWVDALDAQKFEPLVHLREYGWIDKPVELARVIEAAFKSRSPVADVRAVAETVQSFCEANADSEIVMISNGMKTGADANAVAVVAQSLKRKG